MPAPRPFLPIAVTVAAIAVLALMDGVMKGASLALGAYSAMLWRQAFGTALTLPLWRTSRAPWPERAVLKVHLLRGAVTAAMALLFFHSLTLLPIAEAIAISFFAPLIALYLAAVMLGERIARSAVVASLIGLAGVAVISWPRLSHGGARDVEGLAALIASALLYAWNLVLQRRQAQIALPREITFFQTVTGVVLMAPFAPFFARMPDASAMGLVVAASLMSIGSGLLLSWAYARAEAQVLVPMEYSAFGWAAAVGWLAFAEPVTGWTLGGVVLIVAACLVAARRAAPELVAA
jgi:S-adenosylmethionine uptake transporter